MPKITIVQKGPEYLNLSASLKRAVEMIDAAADNGSRLVVFGECWLSGYPVWLDIGNDVNIWDNEIVKDLYSATFRQAPSIPDDLLPILDIAAKRQINVVLGCNERVQAGPGNGSIYNSVITISSFGKIVNHHRKLVPTFTEKLIHAFGDGSGLHVPTLDIGAVGALICWEHFMPLARQALHLQGEDMHIALWPYLKEIHLVAARQYAFEARATVVAVGQLMHKAELPPGLSYSGISAMKSDDYVMKGGSAVFTPDGQFFLEPQYNDKEIIHLTIPTGKEYLGESMTLAAGGHYNRPDVFDFHVDKRRK